MPESPKSLYFYVFLIEREIEREREGRESLATTHKNRLVEWKSRWNQNPFETYQVYTVGEKKIVGTERIGVKIRVYFVS